MGWFVFIPNLFISNFLEAMVEGKKTSAISQLEYIKQVIQNISAVNLTAMKKMTFNKTR